MPHKDFDVPEQGPEDDPITFTLAGRKFTCVPVMPYTTRLMAGAGYVYVRDFHRVIRGCLVEDDEAAFDAVLADKRRPVEPPMIDAIFWWLIEEYGQREGSPILVPAAPEAPESQTPPAAPESGG